MSFYIRTALRPTTTRSLECKTQPSCARRKKVNGVWLNPRYVELEDVQVESGEVLTVKKGTQMIDGWWRILRKEMRSLPKSSAAEVKRAVRAAQWKAWHRSDDLWLAFGTALRRLT